MKLTRFLVAALAGVTVTGGAIVAVPTQVQAATSGCIAQAKSNCFSWFVDSTNDYLHSTVYYLDVERAVSDAPVIMAAENPSDQGEDWDMRIAGSVDTFYKAHELGLTAADDDTYGVYDVFQFEYDPQGRLSGYCMTAQGSAEGSRVVVLPCGNPGTSPSQDWILVDGGPALPGSVGGADGANIISVQAANVVAGHYALENPAANDLGAQLDIGTPTGGFAADWSGCGPSYEPCLPTDIGYVALGDSYSSGEGNPPFMAPNTGCDRSTTWAWPELMAGTDHLTLEALLACSGATTAALTSSFQGQQPQLQALGKLTEPTLITVTMGGDDLGFADVLENCFAGLCSPALAGVEGALAGGFGSHMTAVYKEIKAAAPGARILVVGYPQIVPSNAVSAFGHCLWFKSPTEIALLHAVGVQLNSVLARAAAAAGVDYVSTLNALNGHELCTGQSWMNPVGQSPLSGDAHPNGLGQQAIATTVEEYVVSHNLLPGV